MTSPRSSELIEHANAIYEAYANARAAGFAVDVDQHGRVDLIDIKENLREPLLTAHKRESK